MLDILNWKQGFLVNFTARICVGNFVIRHVPELKDRGNTQGTIFNIYAVGSNGVRHWILPSHWSHGSEPPWLVRVTPLPQTARVDSEQSRLHSALHQHQDFWAPCGLRHGPACLPPALSAHHHYSPPPPLTIPLLLLHPHHAMELSCYTVNLPYSRLYCQISIFYRDAANPEPLFLMETQGQVPTSLCPICVNWCVCRLVLCGFLFKDTLLKTESWFH